MISKKRFWNIVFVFVAIFFLMFFFRLYYGYQTVPGAIMPSIFSGTSLFETSRHNIASLKYKVKSESSPGQFVSVDQKYEKIATLQARTEAYEQDEQALRNLIKQMEAIIQFEQKSGTAGSRVAKFQIGVQPDLFDDFLGEVEKVGTILSKDVSKKDKTNEYRELNAKRQSLEKTKASLVELKTKGGKIGEYVDLENRILDIEDQLQSLGVSLGNYDKENEFCTVKYALNEVKSTRIGIAQRIKVALQWTIQWYVGIVFAFLCVLGCSYLALKIFNGIVRKSDD